MTPATLALVVLLAPLASAAVIALLLRRAGALAAAVSVTAAVIIAAGAFTLAFGGARFEASMTWLRLGSFVLSLGFKFDDLAALMLVIVGIVGLCVHVFSLGYMHDDAAKARYFGGLSIFMFSMLGIVFADNLFMMFIFWELVGFSSWLLINHWHEKQSASDASKKAFITNRVGDFGFLLGIILCYWSNGTVNLSELAAGHHVYSTLIPLLLFCGAVGKSAQLPLQVWLPDAMEGPTPVSALIHAATMVAAGIYMLCRINVLMVPDALTVIMWVGTATALYAALCAIVQRDIKKILAYSTLSQLGYMVAAFGLGSKMIHVSDTLVDAAGGTAVSHWAMLGAATGVGAAMFHLTTHAFFKALLFLGSGSVIHGCHHEQDIFKMGGLSSRMKLTFVTFTIGVAAIIGLCQQQGGLRDPRLHRDPDRALHDAALADHVLRRAAQRVRRACARGRPDPDASAGGPLGAGGPCGLYRDLSKGVQRGVRTDSRGARRGPHDHPAHEPVRAAGRRGHGVHFLQAGSHGCAGTGIARPLPVAGLEALV